MNYQRALLTDNLVDGRAQSPSQTPWRINSGGAERSIEEAIEIARSNGVHIPNDMQFGKLLEWEVPPIEKATYYAEYFTIGQGFKGKARTLDDYVEWEEFYNRFGKIPVRYHPGIFNSDEAIVAVMGHEMHELNKLRKIFETSGGEITIRELRNLINPGIPGNLHDQAWDVSDFLVKKMRLGKN